MTPLTWPVRQHGDQCCGVTYLFGNYGHTCAGGNAVVLGRCILAWVHCWAWLGMPLLCMAIPQGGAQFRGASVVVASYGYMIVSSKMSVLEWLILVWIH